MSEALSAETAQPSRFVSTLLAHAHPGEVVGVFEDWHLTCGCGERFAVPFADGKGQVGAVNEAWAAHVEVEVMDALRLPADERQDGGRA